MGNDVSKITVGKPKAGGALFRAPLGTELPADAKTQLNEAFINLGYLGEDGLVNDNGVETETIKAWGGTTVLTPVTETTDTFEFSLLQVLDAESKKVYFGDKNVTGDLSAGMKVTVNPDVSSPAIWVIEMILSGNTLHRIVIPHGTIAERAEVTYVDGEAVQYGVTISAAPDAQGNSHYEYTVKG